MPDPVTGAQFPEGFEVDRVDRRESFRQLGILHRLRRP